jgi:TPR repeat protein
MLIDGLLETRQWSDIVHERIRYIDKGSPVSRQAFALASAGAALGCAHSKGALARCLITGFGTTGSRVSLGSAAELARFSAQSGSCIGQYVVGLACKMSGRKAEAVEWLHLAAEQGHASAQFDLSIMYSLGDGVAKDKAEAKKWKEKAGAQGHIGLKRKGKKRFLQ